MSRGKLAGVCATHPIPGIAEFCAAIETDLIGSLLNREHAADIVVMAPEQPAEERVHMVRNLVERTHSD